jgi:hypothetical protein
MGCKVNQKINPFGFVGARLANGVLKNDTDIGFCSVFPAPLPAPSGALATAISSSEIQVTWVFSGDISKVSQFQIDRSLDGVDWAFGGITPSNTLVFNDTGRTPETTYFYRVIAIAIPPDTNSIPSNTTSDTTLSANPLDLFGSNLHAWFRADDVVFNVGTVSQVNEKSGNNRHISNTIASEQPTQEDGEGLLTGSKFISFGNVDKLFNNTNWSGLGTDPYFVVVVTRHAFNFSSSNQKGLFGINNADNSNRQHSFSASNSNFGWSVIVNDNPLVNYAAPDFEGGAGTIEGVIMSTYRGSNGRIWENGTEYTLSSDIEGVVTDSFDDIEFSEIFRPGALPLYEIMFIKGSPEDYGLANGDAIKQLYTGYLPETYPLITFNNPNIP